jgi:APA family basic amino acid/polyamine antiporter
VSGPGADAGGSSPPRRVGWFTAACVLISNVIGGGIFTTTGFLARDLGDPELILSLWLVGAFLALAGAMSYSELGAALPYVGGDYLYLRQAYGPLAAFLSGWASFTVGFGAAIAAAAVSLVSYFLRVLPLTQDSSVPAKGLAIGLVWSITAFHLGGVGAGGMLQRLLTSLKITAILGLIVGGFTLGIGSWAHLTSTANGSPSPGPVIVALVFVMYTYTGWNVAGYIAGEIAEPVRMIPRVMIGGTLFVAVTYLLLNLVYFYALPVTALARPPVLPVAEKAAAALWGPTSARLVVVMLCLSIAGAISAMVWAGPRLYYAMARDGMLPELFARVAPNNAPITAILLQSGWASLLILTGSFEQLVIYSGLVLTSFSALTVAGVIVLRRRDPGLTRPYRVPLYPIPPALFIAAALVMVGYSLLQRPLESAFGIMTILVGVPLYLLWGKRLK